MVGSQLGPVAPRCLKKSCFGQNNTSMGREAAVEKVDQDRGSQTGTHGCLVLRVDIDALHVNDESGIAPPR